MKNTPKSPVEVKQAIERAAASMNAALLAANDLMIPVALVPDNTKPQSDSDVAVTKKLLTIVYPAKI